MPDIASVVGPGRFSVVTSGAAAIATVTITPVPGYPNLYLDAFQISGSAAPAAAITATITGLADGTMTIQISANAFSPIGQSFSTRPLPASVAVASGVKTPSNIVLTIPSLGGSGVSSGILFWHAGP